MSGVTRQVESYYRSLVSHVKPGTRLPSERRVAEQLHSSRTTVRLVLAKLAAEKLVYPLHGRGYYKA